MVMSKVRLNLNKYIENYYERKTTLYPTFNYRSIGCWYFIGQYAERQC